MGREMDSYNIIMSATDALKSRYFGSGKDPDTGRYFAEVTGLHRCEADTLEMAIANLAIWIRDNHQGKGE